MSTRILLAAPAPEGEGKPYDTMSLGDFLSLKVALPTMESERISATPAAVTVFTQADILALGVRTLNELLQITAGFDVRRFRGPYDILAVRGISSGSNEHVLLMVDGVRVNDLYSDGTARTVRDIHLVGVARVEIIRGPASALYGADAMAGVVNVITKNGSA